MKKLEDKIKELVELHQRNEQIITLRKSGATYQSIADKFGITRARVHAICKKERSLSNAGEDGLS